MGLTHSPLAQMKHDVLFHLVDALLEILIVLCIALFAATVVPHPDGDNGSCYGDCDGEVDPKADRYGMSGYRVLGSS